MKSRRDRRVVEEKDWAVAAKVLQEAPVVQHLTQVSTSPEVEQMVVSAVAQARELHPRDTVGVPPLVVT